MTQVNGLAAGPATISIGTGANKIVITPALQLNDATFTLSRDQFEMKSQESSRPVAYIVTGMEPSIDISLSRVTAENVALLFGTAVSSTSETVSGVATAKKKVNITDDAGRVIVGQRVLIRTNPFAFRPPVTPPTNVDTVPAVLDGITYTTQVAYDAAYDALVAEYADWVNNEWVMFPNGALVSIDGTNLTYGLQTQRVLTLKITGLPDANGIRAIFGNPDPSHNLLNLELTSNFGEYAS